MSISSEITRITNNVQNTIDTIEATGVTVPDGANSDDLPSLAAALANEKQDKLTGVQGQVVGFDESGKAVAQDAPSGLPDGGTPGQMLYQGEGGAEWGDQPVLYVHLTYSGGYHSDKTQSEIAQAAADGYAVFAQISGAAYNGYVLPYVGEIGGSSVFFTLYGGKKLTFSIQGSTVSPSITNFTAEDVMFLNASSGLSSTNVQDAIEEVNAKIPAKPKSVSVTLSASGWSGNGQTVTVQGVETSGQSVRISPATKTDADNWVAAGVWCSEPTTANQLVFTCDTAPTENININVELQEVQS